MPDTFTVAVLADIHGNVAALDAVLSDLERQPHSATVVAGDLVNHGSRPAEALARVRSLGASVIHGNTDRYLLANEPPPHIKPLIAWVRERLGPDGLDYLAALPFQHRVTPPGGTSPEDDLLVVHATPTDANALLILEPDPFGSWSATPDEEAARLIGDAEANLIVFGHIHRASSGTIRGQRLASVGAVGFPFEGDHRAAYALVSWDGQDWHVTHRHVPYDHRSVAEDILQSKMPFADRLAQRLTEARFLPLEQSNPTSL